MTTAKQDRQFIDDVITQGMQDVLENAIEWIRTNMSPDDVFTVSQLNEWAYENGFTQDED